MRLRQHRQQKLHMLTADEVRCLAPGERGAVTGTIVAMTLVGLDGTVPYLKLTVADHGGGQVLLEADQSVYRPAFRELRVGRAVTLVVRARDDLQHRLLAEQITAHAD